MTDANLTLGALAKLLEERALTLHLRWAQGAWVAWLHADDDPALGVCVGEAQDPETAVQHALTKWDGNSEPPPN